MLTNETKADIVMITEVSPKYTTEIITKQQFTLEGYDMYTNIGEDGMGRGVAIYIANHLATRANAIEVDVNFKESIWVQLNVCDSTNIMLGCIYRSPSSTPVNGHSEAQEEAASMETLSPIR